jgi:hypothetical protein
MDGDGDEDVVVLRSERNTLSILANDGVGHLSAALDHANGPYPANRILAADLDQDGGTDLIVPASDVLVRRSLGGGKLELPEAFPSGSYATATLLVGDLDQNGFLDIVAATPSAATRGVAIRLSKMSLISPGDCNRNGVPDGCDLTTGTSHDANANGIPDECETPFHRGDPNSSGTTDISDAISIFGFLFLGTPPTLSCKESADANSDGGIDLSDGIYLLSWLFTGGPEPAAPGPTGAPCGLDPDPAGSPGDLGCAEYTPCP